LPLDADLLSLHRDEIERAVLHDRFLHLVTVGSCSISPVRHGALSEITGVNNGLKRASVRSPCDHYHHLTPWLAKPFTPRPLRHTERCSTRLTARARASSFLDHQSSFADVPSCTTVLVGATDSGRMHQLVVFSSAAVPCACPFYPLSGTCGPVRGVLPVLSITTKKHILKEDISRSLSISHIPQFQLEEREYVAQRGPSREKRSG
jgi:hypothetical protein